MKHSIDLGRLPPHAHEAEQGVLGCLILDPSKLNGKPGEMFYDIRHRDIYAALQKLAESGAPVDTQTLGVWLRDHGQLDGVGGWPYLTTLTDSTPSAANLDYFLSIVMEKYQAREAIAAMTEAVGKLYDGETFTPETAADLRNGLDALIAPTSEAAGKNFTDLVNYDTDKDPNTLLGVDENGRTTRYLCKGQSAWVIGPSGVGKSSLTFQMAISWAAGKPIFGIRPALPLRVLYVQAENDFGDLAEMARGIKAGLNIGDAFQDDDHDLINENLVVVSEAGCIGQRFCQFLRRRILDSKADLVILDPLLSFAGIDVSRQDQCSQFLRGWLNPVLMETGAAVISAHHTGKPPKEKQAAQNTMDYAYAGLGSSELVNWARAIMVLRIVDDYNFCLLLTKRGTRAGATQPDGTPTTCVWLQHAPDRICWVQTPPPHENEPEPAPSTKAGRRSKVDEIACSNLHSFLRGCTAEGEGRNEIAKRLENWLSTEPKVDASEQTCRRIIERLVETEKLAKKEGLYYVGKNA